jgi:hypothetical protein
LKARIAEKLNMTFLTGSLQAVRRQKRKGTSLFTFWIVSIILSLMTGELANAQHKGISFQAVLKKPDGTYPTVSGLSVLLQVLDPVSDCVLREELHSGVNVSNGYINLVLGSASASTPGGRNPSPVLTIPQVMDNSTTRNGLNCVDQNNNITSSSQTYVPLDTHARKLRLRAVISGDTVVADFNMRAIAYAVNAENLGGKTASEFVQSSVNITQARVESVYSRYAVLDAILNGTYAGNAATATALATAPGACPAGQYISGMTAAGVITCSAPAGSVTNVTSANSYLTVATGTSTPVLTVNVGAVANTVAAGNDARFTDSRTPSGAAGGDLSGTYPNPSVAKIAGKSVVLTTPASGEFLKYDGTNFVNATISTADATKLPLAGGQMSGTIDMNSQNLTNVGYITMSASKNLHLSNNASDPAGLVAADKGKVWFNTTSGEIKYWNGSAAVALGAAGSGLQTFNGMTGTTQTLAIGTSGTAPAWNSATDTHTLNIPMASTAAVTAGLISKTDYDSFNAKLGTASSFAGDVTGTSGALSVDKIKGKAVTPGAYASGQVLRYDGTDWVNAVLGFSDLGSKPTTLAGYGITDAQSSTLTNGKILVGNGSNVATAVTMSGDATLDNTGAITLNTVPISKGGTGLTSFAVDKLVTTSGAGAIQTSSCGLNQVITFTAGGAIACANVSALSASYINDGNSFGAAAVLGTNDANSLSFETNNASRMTILSTGEIGIGNANPATALDVTGAVSQRGMAAPALSPAGQGKIYFDSTSNKFRVSQNGGAFVDMIAATNGTVTDVAAGTGLNVGAGPGGNITSTGTLNVNVGTGANQIVQLDGTAKLPAVDGSALTNLNPAALSSALPIANGGTGQTAKTAAFDALSPNTTKGDLAVHNGTNNIRVPAGTNNYVLTADSAQAAGLKWAALPSAPGDATYIGKGLVQFDTDAATSGVTVAAGVASLNTGTAANQIVKLDGSAKLPAVDGSALTNITATAYSGTLPVANGGTNSNTALNNDRMMVSSAGKIVESAALTNGQIVIGSTGAAPVVGSITASGGAVVTPGAGTLAISTNAVSTNTASTIVTRDASGNFAAGAITNNSNILKGATSGAVTMTVPTTVTPYTLTWPNAVGGAGAFLTTDASGNLSWGSPAAISDSTYAAKGAVQFLTDASTSGITIASGVANVNTGTGANQIVKLDGSSKLPAVDGSALTNLNAGNIATGTLPIARGGTNSGTALTNGKVMVSSAGSIVEGVASSTSKTASTFVMRDGSGNIAGALGTYDQLALNGSVSGIVNLVSPATTANWTMTLPNSAGTNGYVLSTNGSGVTSWVAAGGAGTVTNITAGTGLNVGAGPNGSITSTGTLNIDVGTGASQIVQLTAASKYPAVDGSLITNLAAANLTGAVAIANGGTGQITKTAAFDALSPNTTKGDLAVHNGTNNIRLPAGANDYVLQADSTQASGLKWSALPSAPVDSSYAAKGLVQFLTDAATSGITIASGVANVNTGTGANQIVKLDGTSKLPAVDGSALTNLNAGNIATGTLPIARGGTNSAAALTNGKVMVSSAGSIIEGVASNTAKSNNTFVMRDGSGNIAGALGTYDQLALNGSVSGIVNLVSPATTANWTMTLPNSAGTNGYVLSTNGSGVTTWVAAGGAGTVTNITAGTGLNVGAGPNGSITSTGTLNIDVGTGASQIVQLTAASKYPAVDGSLITNLNPAALSSALPIANGGTGQTAKTAAYDALSPNTTKGDLTVHNGTNNIRVPAGTNNYVLQADSAQASGLKWAALPSAPGDASYVAKGLVQFDTDAATSGITVTSGVATLNTGTTANKIVKLDGSAKLPAVDGSALTNITASAYSGTLPVANGGTNSATALNNDRMMVSSAGKIVEATAMTNGQVVIGSTGAAPVVASITASGGAVVTPGAGTLAISTNAVATNTASTIVSRDASGNFAAGAVTNTSNVLKGATSGAVTMTVPTTVTPYTLTWPNAVGGAGAFLTTDASGNLSWGSPAAISDSTYAAKGAVQFLTDAATSGITIASGVANVNTGTGANQIVKLDGTSKLPAVDGSALTSLNAGNIATGTLPIARGGTNSGAALTNGKVMVSSAGAIVEGVASNTAKTANTFVMRDGSGNIAGALGTYDQLALNGSVSGIVNLVSPATTANWTMTLPTSAGTNGYVLSTNGSGVTSWVAAGGAGTVTNITAGTGLNVGAGPNGSITSTGTLNIDVGTGASQIVQLTAASKYPAVDGSLITSLNPANLSAAVPITKGGTGQITQTAGFDALSPNTTKGDISVHNGTNNVRLPAGTNNYVLQADSAQASGLKWAALPSAPVDSSYAAKGLVQFLTDAATSGITVASGVANVNTGTGANQIVKLDGTSKLPAVDGSALTSLNAGNIATGTLPIARGGTNSAAALTNGKVMVSSAGTIIEGVASSTTKTASTFVMRDGSGNIAGALGTFDQLAVNGSVSGTVNIYAPSTFTTWSLTLPVDDGTSGQVLSTNGSGVTSWITPSGTMGGSGTTGKLAKFTAAGTIGDSVMSESSGNIGIGVTVPTYKFDVNVSGLTANSINDIARFSESSTGRGVVLGYKANSGGTGLQNAFVGTVGPVDLNLGTATQSNASMTIQDSTGYVGIGTTNPGALLDLGTAGTKLGTMRLEGNTSGYVQIQPSAAAGSWTMTLPTSAGTSGYVLSTNGSGVTSWVAAGGAGTVTNITAGTGLNVGAGPNGSITSTGTLNIDVGTAASKIVQLTAAAKYPAVDGSLITNLDPTNLSAAVPLTKGGTGQITKTASYDALSPNTTKGDIAVHNGTNNIRVPAGTNNYVLTADSAQASGVKWAAAPGGSDASYSAKGIVQILTDAATSGLTIASGVLNVNFGTGANQIVKLDGTSKLPAVDGSALTNLNAGNIATGTLAVARGGTGVTTFGNNTLLVTNGTGVLTPLSCALGEYLTFGAAGIASCGSASSGSGFVNGGNSFSAAATLGTNDANSLTLETNNSPRVTILSGGAVGVGNASPTAALDIVNASTATSGAIVGMKSQQSVTSGSVSTAAIRGVYGISSYASTATSPSATVTAVEGYASNPGSGTIGSAYGIFGNIENQAAGTISLAYAGNFSVTRTAGTITNARGINIGTIQGTNKFSLYASDATAPSHFAGAVGIGTTTPNVPLNVNLSSSTMPSFTPDGGTVAMFTGGAGNSGAYTNVSIIGGQTTGASYLFLGSNTSEQESAVYWNATDKRMTLQNQGIDALSVKANGYVGVGTTSARTSLDVNGAITSKAALSVAAASVDFASNNLAYTAQNCGAFVLNNMKDGASYTFAVQGTTSATCAFTAYSGSGTTGPLTVKLPPDHAPTTAGKDTIYTFVVLGSTVYTSWIPGY